jgi:spore maturation protein CgeB
VIGYKILRLQGLTYSAALAEAGQICSDETDLGYSELKERLLCEKILFSGGFAEEMTNLGHCAEEIIFDCELLQRKWAEEKSFDYSEENWNIDIVIGQIMDAKPDILFLQDIFSLPESVRKEIKNICPSIRLIVIQKGYPGETRNLSDADILLVSSPVLYRRYRNLNRFLVYHAFDQSVLTRLNQPVNEGDPEYGFIFAGSSRYPEYRYRVILELMGTTELQIWTPADPQESETSDKIPNRVVGGNWPNRSSAKSTFDLSNVRGDLSLLSRYGLRRAVFEREMRRKIKNKINVMLSDCVELGDSTSQLSAKHRIHPPCFGMDYYKLLASSSLVFNLHAEKAGDTVDNMKMFETTGVGSCLLTDNGENLPDLFEPDQEVVVYSSMKELKDKVAWLLGDEKVRSEIARAGQRRTLKHHTTSHRCQQIDEIIRGHL